MNSNNLGCSGTNQLKQLGLFRDKSTEKLKQNSSACSGTNLLTEVSPTCSGTNQLKQLGLFWNKSIDRIACS
jgi:hypothetical protein